jgi:hypothetical protein
MLPKVKSILRQKGYRIFTRPFELNIVGIRSRHTRSNSFDDELHVFYRDSRKKWKYHIFKITTDPGTFWLKEPLASKGTAILAEGQYLDAYGIGMHQGKYYALCQLHKPVTVIRDYNRDAILDFMNGRSEKGMFGINIHRARAAGETRVIDEFSAGCQVFKDAADFVAFMALCEQHKKLYGNRFTYTLIDFRAMRREIFRRMAYGGAALGLGILSYIRYEKFF